jgi:hypothetical protein
MKLASTVFQRTAFRVGLDASAAEMNNFRFGGVAHLPVQLPDATAQISIFQIHEKSFVHQFCIE